MSVQRGQQIQGAKRQIKGEQYAELAVIILSVLLAGILYIKIIG